ncbi:hypothetical protein CN127_16700, partial [Sinorhizobium meliloti]
MDFPFGLLAVRHPRRLPADRRRSSGAIDVTPNRRGTRLRCGQVGEARDNTKARGDVMTTTATQETRSGYDFSASVEALQRE